MPLRDTIFLTQISMIINNKYYLLSTYYMPDTLADSFHIRVLGSKECYFHSADEVVESWEKEV